MSDWNGLYMNLCQGVMNATIQLLLGVEDTIDLLITIENKKQKQ